MSLALVEEYAYPLVAMIRAGILKKLHLIDTFDNTTGAAYTKKEKVDTMMQLFE